MANEPHKTKHSWAWPSGPMDRIHMGYFEPYYGKNYLVMVDSFSKWCDVKTTNSTNTKSTIDLCRGWFSQYGLPNQIITDNGTQFKSDEFRIFCQENGIKHITTAPYHQSTNGQAERFVQTIKKGLQMNDIEKGVARRSSTTIYLRIERLLPLLQEILRQKCLYVGSWNPN